MTVIDLPGFLRSIGISAELKGDEYSSLCPFHQEKSPSFSMNADWPHKYHCFGCHTSGNIYTFIKELLGKSFREVFGDVSNSIHNMYWNNRPTYSEQKLLARESGDIVIERSGDIHPIQANPEALEYIRGRGISDAFIRHSGMYATRQAWINKSKMFNRILIDCYFEGKVVNVEARDYTGKADRKVLYPWGLKKDFFFYNQDNIKLDEDIVIVEGIMDLAKVWDVYPNVVSAFGSGYAKENRKKEILKDWGKRIVVMPDNDLAGISSLENLYELLDCEFWVAELKESKDAGDASLLEIENALSEKRKITDWLYDKKEQVQRKIEW